MSSIRCKLSSIVWDSSCSATSLCVVSSSESEVSPSTSDVSTTVLFSIRPSEKSPGAAVSSGEHTPAGLLCIPSTISRANFDLSRNASFRECSHCSLLLLEYGSSSLRSLRAAIFPLMRARIRMGPCALEMCDHRNEQVAPCVSNPVLLCSRGLLPPLVTAKPHARDRQLATTTTDSVDCLE